MYLNWKLIILDNYKIFDLEMHHSMAYTTPVEMFKDTFARFTFPLFTFFFSFRRKVFYLHFSSIFGDCRFFLVIYNVPCNVDTVYANTPKLDATLFFPKVKVPSCK